MTRFMRSVCTFNLIASTAALSLYFHLAASCRHDLFLHVITLLVVILGALMLILLWVAPVVHVVTLERIPSEKPLNRDDAEDADQT